MLLCGGGEKRGTGERDGRNVAAGLLRACVALLLARVNGFYTLHKTNHVVQSFVLSFVRTSFSIFKMRNH